MKIAVLSIALIFICDDALADSIPEDKTPERINAESEAVAVDLEADPSFNSVEDEYLGERENRQNLFGIDIFMNRNKSNGVAPTSSFVDSGGNQNEDTGVGTKVVIPSLSLPLNWLFPNSPPINLTIGVNSYDNGTLAINAAAVNASGMPSSGPFPLPPRLTGYPLSGLDINATAGRLTGRNATATNSSTSGSTSLPPTPPRPTGASGSGLGWYPYPRPLSSGWVPYAAPAGWGWQVPQQVSIVPPPVWYTEPGVAPSWGRPRPPSPYVGRPSSFGQPEPLILYPQRVPTRPFIAQVSPVQFEPYDPMEEVNYEKVA